MTVVEQPDQLAPIRYRLTSEKAREAQAKSVEARRRNREAVEARKDQVAAIVAELDRTQLGPVALAVALKLALAVVAGDIPIPRDALERKRLAETAEILHRIGRLELGESTSNAVTLTGDLADLDAKRADLAAQLAKLGETPSAP